MRKGPSTDEVMSFVSIQLLCGDCYDEAKAERTKGRRHAERGDP
jgi:hypothetical protein